MKRRGGGIRSKKLVKVVSGYFLFHNHSTCAKGQPSFQYEMPLPIGLSCDDKEKQRRQIDWLHTCSTMSGLRGNLGILPQFKTTSTLVYKSLVMTFQAKAYIIHPVCTWRATLLPVMKSTLYTFQLIYRWYGLLAISQVLYQRWGFGDNQNNISQINEHFKFLQFHGLCRRTRHCLIISCKR